MKFMFVVDHLAYNQSNYAIFNEINRMSSDVNAAIVPLNASNKMMDVNAAIMNVSEISEFSDGVMIATTIEQAAEILSAANNSIKVLYLWDLDWMFNLVDYEYLYDVLNDPKLNIFVRSATHADAVLEISQSCITIQPDFNLEKIWNSLKETAMLS